jgi:hypothetical protein
MKTFYAKSVLEGAPHGNKNAAGPHNMSGSKVGSVSFERPYRSNPRRENITVNRYSPMQQDAVRSKTYKNVSGSSQERMLKALIKDKAKGTQDGWVRGFVSRNIPRKKSEIYNVEINQNAPVRKIDKTNRSSVKFSRSRVDNYGDSSGGFSSKTYYRPTKSSLARVRRVTKLG